ncbi:MAG: leucine-rich repeat protein, partial [Clostridiales bacterium]|nr:leucine-rich repeat protein [Clostridiales bacterium]
MSKFKIRTSKIAVFAIGILLAFTLSIALTLNCEISVSAAGTDAMSATITETKIYSKATVNDAFDDSSVLVVLDKQTSGINKQHDDIFFGDFAKIAVYDLTYIDSAIKNRSSIDETEFHQILKIELPVKSKANILNVISQLEKIDEVLIAEPNYTFEPAAQPMNSSGTRYSNLWGMHDTFGIQAEDAWNITTGVRNSVRVGVIDSEMEFHSDLTGNRVNEGGDFFNMANVNQNIPGPLRTNIDGHGTHVAGTIGATGTNTNGIAGVAWNVQLIPLQISFWDTSVTPNRWRWGGDALVRAIRWCTANNVDIINLSGGGFGDSATIRNVINDFQGLFVAAAGNGNDAGVGQNNDTTRYYPSDYSRGQTFSGRFMSVGAINNTGNITGFSNFGATSVSIFAPGNGIWSCVPNAINATGYAAWNGTSMATPHVTGTAALMFSVYSNMTHNLTRAQLAANIKAAIINNAAVDTGSPLNGLCVANGRLNAFRAVSSIAFETSPYSGGISIDGFINGFTLPNNTNLTLPDQFAPLGATTQQTVAAIGASAFTNQTMCTEIIIPSGVTTIGDWAFDGCSNLTSISLPSGITGIGIGAFIDCTNLTGIIVPNGVTIIGGYAFYGCAGLTNITIPSSVASVGTGAFLNCMGLSVRWYYNQSVDADIFKAYLKEVIIGGVTSIADGTFSGCTELQAVELSDGVTRIGSYAFYGCVALQSADLPASVKSIGANA